MTRRVVLLGWLFLTVSAGSYNFGTATVVGPFASREDCDLVRLDLATRPWVLIGHWCWWDGKP